MQAKAIANVTVTATPAPSKALKISPSTSVRTGAPCSLSGSRSICLNVSTMLRQAFRRCLKTLWLIKASMVGTISTLRSVSVSEPRDSVIQTASDPRGLQIISLRAGLSLRIGMTHQSTLRLQRRLKFRSTTNASGSLPSSSRLMRSLILKKTSQVWTWAWVYAS